MKYTIIRFFYIIVLILVVLFNISGKGGQEAPKTLPPEIPQTESPLQAEAINIFEENKSELDSILMLYIIENSFDSFNSLIQGNDRVYLRQVEKMVFLRPSNFQVGRKISILFYNDEASNDRIVGIALLEKTVDGIETWGIKDVLNSKEIYYEVLVSPESYVLSLRFINPDTQKKAEIIPEFIVELNKIEDALLKNDAVKKYLESIESELAGDKSACFTDPQFLKKENIIFQNSEIEADIIQDIAQDTTITKYWVSKSIPGYIYKRSITSPDGKERNINLGGITENNTAVIKADEIIEAVHIKEKPELQSDGIKEDPVAISLNVPYIGAVNKSSTSYFKLDVNKTGDLFIKTNSYAESLEFQYFKADKEFSSMVFSSKDSASGIEELYVEAGSTFYFCIKNYSEQFSEQFLINAFLRPYLSPEGVKKKGDASGKAKLLRTYKEYELNIAPANIEYYKVKSSKDGTLLITSKALPSYASIVFLGVDNNSYNNSEIERVGNQCRIIVEGIKQDSTCYFYITADPDLVKKDDKFFLSLLLK